VKIFGWFRLPGVIVCCMFPLAAQQTRSQKQLERDIADGYSQSILAAGRSGDVTLIPLIKTRVGKAGIGYPTADDAAKLALARLGEQEWLEYWYKRFHYRTDEVKNLKQSELRDIVEPRIDALEYIGGWFAVECLRDMLDSDVVFDKARSRYRYPDAADWEPKELVYPSHKAIVMLKKMFPDASPGQGWARNEAELRERWKQWIIDNEKRLREMKPSSG
jgi:hypothetical protein